MSKPAPLIFSLAERLIKFNSDRLPDMVKLKYEAMASNLFRFYRGSNHIFYQDLYHSELMPPSPASWISGDLHLENFGSYKSDNRLVYFDLNDFDEAVLAPALFEPVRLATSIFIAFEALQIEQKQALNMAQLCIKTYANKLAKGKPHYIEPQTAKGIVRDFLVKASKKKQKAILAKRTEVDKNKIKILLDDPRHFKIRKTLKKELFDHITSWLKNDENSPYNYEVMDGVFRLAGTGSVGVRRYAFLLRSSNKTGDKYMLLDMKQAVPSSLLPYVAFEQPVWTNEAERVVSIQHLMQNRPPALLSTSVFQDHSYVMQEMQPTKDSINFKLIRKQYRDIYQVIDDMAVLTASSQLRSSGRHGAANGDALVAFGAEEKWRSVVLDYAIEYAHQVKKDYLTFLKDLKAGVFNIQ